VLGLLEIVFLLELCWWHELGAFSPMVLRVGLEGELD